MLMGNLRRSRTGRAIIGVRDNERGAASFAIDPTRIRLAAAAVAGGLCGLAGALYAVALRGVGFAGFDPAESIQAFTMVVVGGLGSLGTAVLGALYVRGAEYELQGALQLLATGAGLLVLLLWVPGGLGSIAIGIRDRFVRWAAARHGTALDLGVAAFRPDASTGARPVEDAFLRVDRLDAGYGPVQVLFGASLGVRRGEILALVGTNGAGKSTLLGVVAGLRPAAGGGVWLDGQRLRGDAAARARAGVSLMPGGKAVFASLTVAENLRVAGWLRRAPAADVLMLFPALQARMGTRAGLLSGGEQQMLGMAMSLLAGPDLLLIDELSLGLAPTVVAGLLDAVKQINAAGTTVVIVEQSINVAATLAEDAAFLERGTVRFAGPTRELLDRGDLARAVFLRPPSRRAPATGAGAAGRTGAAGGAGDGSAALAVEHVSVAFGGVTAVGDVSLSVGHGSIVGLIGSNGAGKTTLLDALSGFVNVRSGHIELGGSDVTGLPPAARARRGLGRSFQGARLFPSLTVTETLALACERQVSVRDPIAASLRLKAARGSERAVWARVEALVEQHHLGPFRDAFISELSTGTRRIVELACAFAHQPSVLLLDEPSSGLAQREAEALSDVLAGLRASLGAALLIVEHDIPLVAGLADELVCLHHGSVLAAGRPDDVLAHPAVVAACLGADDRTVTRSGRRSRARPTPRSADEVRPV
jgi:branched-chain amino acid transport system ATP-binding protein